MFEHYETWSEPVINPIDEPEFFTQYFFENPAYVEHTGKIFGLENTVKITCSKMITYL
jgi:hypothetical protein